jgi:uncharacterized protein with HEPN domain
MKDRNEKLFLVDIQECCQKIGNYIAGVSKEDFLENQMLQDALVRNIEIIGEASKNLSGKTREGNSNIRWRDIMRMRDKIVHHYFRLNLSIVWETVTKDIPVLKSEVDKILKSSSEK